MKYSKKPRFLVTGAGGFIGSHVTDLLARSGADITAFVRYTSTGRAGYIDQFPRSLARHINIVYGDIRDRDDVVRAVHGKDIIIHLAAQIAIPYSYLAPHDFLTVNAVGTANLLSAARQEKVKQIVLLSTSEVYGSAQYLPIDENHPQVAQSPYAASKIAADKFAEAFYRSYDLPVVIARPFNTYGPRQSARAVIPTIIIQALKGTTVHLGNTAPRRDLNFVEDTARNLVAIARSTKGVGGQFNLCSGTDHSIGDVAKLVGRIIGKRLTIKSERKRVRPRKSEVDRLLGDGSRADSLFRLKPRTDLTAGLEKTITWFEKNIDRFDEKDFRL